MKNLYLVGNIFENDRIERQIKTSPELIFNELTRLRNENNQLHQQSDLKKMVTDLTATINKVDANTDFIKKLYTTPKVIKTSKVKLTKEEKTLDLLNRITKRK